MEVIGLQFGVILPNVILILILMISASSWLKIIHVVAAESAANNMSSKAKPGCRERCGDITVPFPFGIGGGCFLDKWYEIDCNITTQIPTLKKVGLEVFNILLPTMYRPVGLMGVKLPITYSSSNCSSDASPERHGLEESTTDLSGSNFVYSQKNNIFFVVGCDKLAFLNNTNNALVGCQTKCHAAGIKSNSSSNYTWSLDSCGNTIPSNLQAFNINFQKPAIIDDGDGVTATNNSCSYATLLVSGYNLDYHPNLVAEWRKAGQVEVILEWGITQPSDVKLLSDQYSKYRRNHYICEQRFNQLVSTHCYCKYGFDGNAYLVNGCQDIDECQDPKKLKLCDGNKCVNTIGDFSCIDGRRTIKLVLICIGAVVGAFILLFLGRWLYRAIKRRKQLKLKQKFFKQNGGLLLQQQLSSPEGNVEKGKLFNSNVLEKATDNFSDDRILGQGGQGTVYKGMLMDGTIVAIKKSKLLDEGYVEQFINEVFILSQINHRNVVKLLGCCLETEVPLLVYEFIPNGTLYQYLHNPDEEFLVSWEVRMRLATEVAGALAYLHSAASIPIYHRDVKTTNILLDDKYRAKIADFGTSKSVALDQTHVTTLVLGTFGYLDPEYFQSSQFTDKSDVYSFGVVLVELLTGQKPISSFRAEEGRSLATYFILAMEANQIFDIIDTRVLNQAKKEEIIVVANLAKRCLHLNGRNRPTMKEVAIELEGIVKKPQQHCYPELQNESDRGTARIEGMEIEAYGGSTVKSAGSNLDVDMSSSTWDVSPLLSDSW